MAPPSETAIVNTAHLIKVDTRGGKNIAKAWTDRHALDTVEI